MTAANSFIALLLPFIHSTAVIVCALQAAVSGGSESAVRLLLSCVDPRLVGPTALQWAAEDGRLPLVRLLLPVSDAKAENSAALRWAAINGHQEVSDALIEHSDRSVAWERLRATKNWQALDRLALAVSHEWVQAALKEAPAGTMLASEALTLSQALTIDLAPASSTAESRSSGRPRL